MEAQVGLDGGMAVEQYRFPRSKRKRIRRKWSKQAVNWRPRTNFIRVPNGIYEHPELAKRLQGMGVV